MNYKLKVTWLYKQGLSKRRTGLFLARWFGWIGFFCACATATAIPCTSFKALPLKTGSARAALYCLNLTSSPSVESVSALWSLADGVAGPSYGDLNVGYCNNSFDTACTTRRPTNILNLADSAGWIYLRNTTERNDYYKCKFLPGTDTGFASVMSYTPTPVVTPASPTNLTATTISPTQIDLFWTDNSSDETGFKIESPAGTLINTTAANTTSYNHTGLTCNTPYTYSVKATNANGDSTGVTASTTTAACPVATYSVTTNTAGTGTGTVNGAGNFAVGATVTLTATPTIDSIFVSWSPAPCAASFMMPANNLTCTAQFDKATISSPPTTTQAVSTEGGTQAVVPALLSLMMVKLGPGNLRSDPAGIDCGTTCQASYPSGTVVTLIATPNDGATFKEWSGDCNSPALTTTVMVKMDTHCQATFVEATNTSTTLPAVTPPSVPVTITVPVTTPVVTPPVEVTPSPVTTPLPVTIAGANFSCSPTGDIGEACNYGGREVTNLNIQKSGMVSNGLLNASVVNQGWVSNFHITTTGKLSGGVVTGYIKNEGVMLDFEFVGMSIIGGTLGGVITNNSRVGGYFQDVALQANTKITGGTLKGSIKGDKNAPALLENVRVKSGSNLVGVKLGKNVKLEKGVVMEDN